ncbi:MAG: M1 family metallopeptidase [candidate division Zixibacteria bacterium]
MIKALIFSTIFLLPLTAQAEEPYFQQRVIYDIKADIDPESAKIAGIENITYFNNSPDTLNEIYFHLYYNAFQPGSYLDKQERRAGYYQIANTSPKKQGDVAIDRVEIDGQQIENYLVDNTIMTVPLISGLAPGDSVIFYIEFTSQIPARGSRTAYGGKHFDIGQWYPKPSVYDRYGWHAHQYLDYEFYADFADFDVELTMPSEYIIAHVGRLLNEEEIFGGLLRVPDGDSIIVNALEHLIVDSSAVVDSIIPEEELAELEPIDDEIIPDSLTAEQADTIDIAQEDDDRKTWKIKAENVHDFAFCANPKFIIDIGRYNDVIIKTYYYKSVKKRWERKSVDYTRKSLKLFSEKFFPYPYTQYSTVASLVGGGMEYPQLTMITRRSGLRGEHTHSLESIIAHEVAHAWFYGILGFNETEQSYLDEGLTSFATTLYLEHYYGRYENNFSYKKEWQKRLLPNGNERNDEQRSYINRARERDEDPVMTPANLFATGGRYYNASYQKALSIYFMLEYTLGNEKFDRFMQLLFKKWALKHPYLIDFQEIAEEAYGGDLDWFFRQWFTTTWSLDYSLDSFKREKTEVDGVSGYNASISIGKPGRCISPLDVAFYMKDGSTETIGIPLEAWEDGQLSFDTTVFLPGKPKKAIVNPDGRLADINRLDNSSGCPPVRFQLLVPRFLFRGSYIEHFVSSYTVAHQPLLWYNSKDGVKPGYRFFGSYLGEAKKLDLDASIGSMTGNVSCFIEYEDVLYDINPDISYFINTREEEGRGRQVLGMKYRHSTGWGSNYFRMSLSLKRHYMFDDSYIYGGGWSPGDVNTIELTLNRGFRRRLSRINFDAKLTSSVPGSKFDYTRAEGGLLLTLLNVGGNDTRLRIKAGVANGEVPYQQRFFLSSANPYEIWNSEMFRSKGTLPDEWKDRGHLFKSGGAGLSGYLDRGLTGTRLLSVRLTREMPSLRLPINLPVISRELRKVSYELYAVSGLVWERGRNPAVNDYLTEAGIRFEYKVPILDRFVEESRVVLYLPLWLSDPDDDEEELEWRWLYSITP